MNLAKTNVNIGTFEIIFAHPFQPFQIEIDSQHLEKIQNEGISLSLIEGAKDAWFFKPNVDAEGLQPQLLFEGRFDTIESFKENLLSLNSFAPFGWIGGCVQDALFELAKVGSSRAEKVLKNQLSLYLDYEKGVVFENPHTIPMDGHFNSLEDFLPFAPIVHYYPNHKAVNMAIDYILSKESPNGIISTGHITTEGCYTLAYPLASIAVAKNSKELAHKAIAQIRFRTEYLFKEDAIFQRGNFEGYRGYRNWGRGIVWYLLGTAKTLAVLKNSSFNLQTEIEQVESDFQKAVKMVVKWQTKNGLWRGFIDRPESVIDTSASAGIGAALVLGYKTGLLDKTYLLKAIQTRKNLLEYITPDGFLTHMSQINRGGEDLQESSYRVISQFGMGLFGQLNCFLNEN